jgi:hypothetical protein
MMPYLDELYGAAQDAAPEQPADAAITGVGRVEYGRDPAWWQSGGNFTPNDVLPTAAAALGGVAGLAQSGARGLAWEALKQGGGEAAKRYLADPAERIFETGSQFVRDQAGNIVPRVALGLAALGGAADIARRAFGGKTPTDAAVKSLQESPNAGVGVSAPAAARVIKTRADRIEAATDMNTMTQEQFVAKWGALPDRILSQ